MSQTHSVLYFYDALCGWCYGFSPVVRALHDKYAEKAVFTVLSGGMVMGSRVEPIRKMAAYIEQSYPRVEQMTGVKFGEAFLKNILRQGDYLSNSEPPALALTAFKSFQPENAVAFASDLQRAFYFDGLDLNSDLPYEKLAAQYGIDAGAFLSEMKRGETKRETEAEFAAVQQMGVSGFPTLVYSGGTSGDGVLLAHGYKSFDAIDDTLSRLLNS